MLFTALVFIVIAFGSLFAENAPAKSLSPEQQIMSPLDFKDADIQDVIRIISKGYNINIVLDKDVVGKVTVHLSDVSVIEGLQTLARSNGYEVIKDGNVYRLRKTVEERHSTINFLGGKLTVDVQNVNIKDLLKEISVLTSTSIVPDSKVEGEISGKLYQVDLDDGLHALLEGNGFQIVRHKNIYQVSMGDNPSSPAKRPQGKASGSSGLYIDFSNGKLTLDASNCSLQEIIKAISEKSDMQIITYGTISGEISAKLRNAPLTKALALLLGGTMFTFVQKDSIILIGDRNSSTPAGQALSKFELMQLKSIKADNIPQILPKDLPAANIKVIKEQNALLVSGTSEEIVAIRDFVNTVDIPTPQVSIDAVIVEYSENLQKESGINYWFNNDKASSQSYFTVPSPNTKAASGSTGFEVGLGGDKIKKLIGNMLGWGETGHEKTLIEKLPDEFFMVVRFLEMQDKAKVLAQPSIVTLNGNKASINVSETQYFKVATTGITGDTISTRFQPITFGIKLDITPWISLGGQITTEIAPEVSNSDGTSTEGYPNVSSRTMATTVRVNDGETIILGGLIKNNESQFHRKIPILGDIPLLGGLFKYSGKTRSKTNLVVYITPHIIKGGGSANVDSTLERLGIISSDSLERKNKEARRKAKQKSLLDTNHSGNFDSLSMPAHELKPEGNSLPQKKSITDSTGRQSNSYAPWRPPAFLITIGQMPPSLLRFFAPPRPLAAPLRLRRGERGEAFNFLMPHSLLRGSSFRNTQSGKSSPSYA